MYSVAPDNGRLQITPTVVALFSERTETWRPIAPPTARSYRLVHCSVHPDRHQTINRFRPSTHRTRRTSTSLRLVPSRPLSTSSHFTSSHFALAPSHFVLALRSRRLGCHLLKNCSTRKECRLSLVLIDNRREMEFSRQRAPP